MRFLRTAGRLSLKSCKLLPAPMLKISPSSMRLQVPNSRAATPLPVDGARTEFRYRIFQYRPDSGAIIFRCRLLQRLDPFSQCPHGRLVRLCRHYARDSYVDGGFLGCEQDFVKPLPRSFTGKSDFDIMARLKTREPDHTFGKINNLDRLAHIEHIN